MGGRITEEVNFSLNFQSLSSEHVVLAGKRNT